MVTAVLTAAGGALGSAVGGAIGGSILGLSAASIGTTLGQLAGTVAGRAITAGSGGNDLVEVGQITNTQVMSSREGTPINRGWGRCRVAGTMIWWAHFQENVTETTTSSGGKGGGGGSSRTTRTYSYTLSFAVGLCEGPVDYIGRIWANGQRLDESRATVRRYVGTETQQPDPEIEAVDGAGNAPGYRGLAYVVFEGLDLNEFGNRAPQISAEIVRNTQPLPLQGACLIPGSTEVGYDPEIRTSVRELTTPFSASESGALNVFQEPGRADVLVSLDQLESGFPTVQTVLLVVGWFFDDLRIDQAVIEPKFSDPDKGTTPAWTVSGFTRGTASEVSYVDGNPAYGSSPDDRSVYRLLLEMKSRGFNVIIYPFLFGDVPAQNSLPDPYSDNASDVGQPTYPWRGRMTLSVAPGYAGTPDKTAAAAAEVASFFGSAAPADFGAWTGSTIPYSGPADGGLRRMILHYAGIASAAGLGAGDAIAIGSEMVQVNAIRSDATTFAAMSEWTSLAADVRSMLPAGVEITYASDWSEATFFQAQDGTGDVFHHLDPLWSDPNIDFVAIDNYMPLADINPDQPDPNGLEDQSWLQYDLDYLKGNVEGGEYWDYFYPTFADREQRNRTTIVDGALGKDWVFRRKAIRDWWQEEHYDRPGGAESATPTAWTPQSKRIVFTEYGFPAIDLGANQPNVFYDPKSSEAEFPYFSTGAQDEAAQQQAIRALLEYWSDNMPVDSGGAPMIDLSMSCAWAWDARPYPAFPDLENLWVDAANQYRGHWLNGRSGYTIGGLLEAVAEDYGIALNADADHAAIAGFVIENVSSYRDAVQDVLAAWAVDLIDTGVDLRAKSRVTQVERATLSVNDFAVNRDDPARFQRERQRQEDLPAVLQVSYISADSEAYDRATVSQVRNSGGSGRLTFNLPFVLREGQAADLAGRILRERHAEVEGLSGLSLPASLLQIETGDLLRLTDAGRSDVWQVNRVVGGVVREFDARQVQPSVLRRARTTSRPSTSGGGTPDVGGEPVFTFIPLNLPQLTDEVADHRGYAAVFARPWPGLVDIMRSRSQTSGYSTVGTAREPAIIGSTLTDLAGGPPDRWQEATVRVQLASGTLGSVDRLDVLAGENALALQTPDGWEIMQFRDASLVAARTYDLSGLIRGRLGTEDKIQGNLPAGAGVVALNNALVPINMSPGDIGVEYWWKVVRAGRPDSGTFTPERHTFTGEGRRPWAPAHVRGARDGSGNLTITWMRRSREGSSWGLAQAPLAEEVEKYEVDILDGQNVVRTLTTDSESVQYPAGEQTSDFGSLQPAIDVIVYQIGSTYGRGGGEKATL